MFISDGNDPGMRKDSIGGALPEKEKIYRGHNICLPTFEKVSYEKGLRPTLCMAPG